MSDSKRPTGSTRSPRKKSRPKSDTATVEKDEVVPEPTVEAQSRQEAKAPTAPEASQEPKFTDDDVPSDSQEGTQHDLGEEAHGADEQEDLPSKEGAPSGPRIYPIDEYMLQVHYDKTAKVFVAAVLEFPDIKATGTHREGVVRDLENRVNNHLANLKKKNEPAPEGYANRRTLEPLQIQVSQSLFRRLEQLSRFERVPMEQLISEMLAGAIEKRGEKRAEGPRPHQQHDREPRRDNRNDNRNQQHGRDRENAGNQRHGGGGREGNRPQPPRHRGGRHNINETLDNRENFMEYVRNLEKGNWRKR